jgi:hypothetical protein
MVLRLPVPGTASAADVLPRIFDRLVQAERRPDRSQGGLGIGLSLVRRLVEMDGGTITAHGEGPGRGGERPGCARRTENSGPLSSPYFARPLANRPGASPRLGPSVPPPEATEPADAAEPPPEGDVWASGAAAR